MSTGRIAVRYATPILELAEERKVLDKVKADMETFTTICSESRDFSLMLKSPIIPHAKKAEILKKIFAKKVDDLTLQAFDIIAIKSREDLLEDIAREFLHLYNQKKGLAEVSVTTPTKLDKTLTKAFEKFAKEITGKDPILENKVDPELIGGYILKVGDRQIDESISGQLKELKLKFSKK
ncbi:MAG: ATP synthase F1 subunit delta [Ekhidna sp.]|nr:ATP synthase F1 subunit delta [Ekhidna sp.]